jgi:hypothetical protein
MERVMKKFLVAGLILSFVGSSALARIYDSGEETAHWTNTQKRTYSRVEEILRDKGLCHACADVFTEIYINHPDARCALLVRSALGGDDSALKELGEVDGKWDDSYEDTLDCKSGQGVSK